MSIQLYVYNYPTDLPFTIDAGRGTRERIEKILHAIERLHTKASSIALGKTYFPTVHNWVLLGLTRTTFIAPYNVNQFLDEGSYEPSGAYAALPIELCVAGGLEMLKKFLQSLSIPEPAPNSVEPFVSRRTGKPRGTRQIWQSSINGFVKIPDPENFRAIVVWVDNFVLPWDIAWKNV